MNKTIYTCIFGNNGYVLNEPNHKTNGWDYVCFTDNKSLKSNSWNIEYIDSNRKDIKKLSRKVKILYNEYLPGADINIFIDSRFSPVADLNLFVNKNLNGDMAVMNHNKRNCIYKEVQFIIKKKMLSANEERLLLIQSMEYSKCGIPNKYGLWSPGIMIRKRCDKMKRFSETWYNEIRRYTHRDMIGLAYSIYKHRDIVVSVMPFKKTYEMFMEKQNVF